MTKTSSPLSSDTMRAGLAGLLVLVTGCGGGSAISVPRPAALTTASLDSAIAFAAATTPTESRDIRIRWQFRDDQGAAGGQGRVRLALPDSARLDVRGPLGSGRAAAFVSGDTALWAEPEGDIKRLVPNYPLFWALLGVVRRPTTGSVVRQYSDGQMTAWQFQDGADTVDYVRRRGQVEQLYAEVRQAGKKLGTVLTVLGPDGRPVSARLVVPSVPARLDITFSSNELAKPFAPDTWHRPQP